MAFFINLGLQPGPGVKMYNFKMQKIFAITSKDKEGTVLDKKYLFKASTLSLTTNFWTLLVYPLQSVVNNRMLNPEIL